MADVLTVGMAVADIVMQVDTLPTRAEKYRANAALITLGGCAANAAVAVNRLGGTGRLAARLGRDPIGDLIVGALSAEGVDASLCDRRDGARSSFSAIHVDATGERQITNYRGDGFAETLDLSAAKPASVLSDNRSPDLLAAAFAAARTSGAPIVIDAEAPFDPETVRGATHIAFSMQGLRDYASDSSIETALARARADLGGWIAVTDGANGVFFTDSKGGVSHVAAFSVQVVDTLAAGDVWHGAFALRLAEGAVETDAARFANAASALKCTRFGGATACPDRKMVEQFLREDE